MDYKVINYKESQVFILVNESIYIEHEDIREYVDRDRDPEKGEIILLKDRSSNGKYMEYIADTIEEYIPFSSEEDKSLKSLEEKYFLS